MRILFLSLTPFLFSVVVHAHDESVECYTKAVIEDVRANGLLARGEMKCVSGDRVARTPVNIMIRDVRGPLPPHLVGQKVKLETDDGEQTGEICIGDEDSELFAGARVGVFVANDFKGRGAPMRRIYSAQVNHDGELVTDARFLRAERGPRERVIIKK